MGSPVTGMLANSGITGTSQQELCAQAATPAQKAALGCPPDQAQPPPPQPPQQQAVPPAPPMGGGGYNYPELGARLQSTPQLATSGVLTPPELAGGQAWNATEGAKNAYQLPSILDVLRSVFGAQQ